MPFDLSPISLKPQFSTNDEISEMYARLEKTFRTGTTRPLAYRRRQLLQLARLVQDNFTAFEDALTADLNRPRVESALTELVPITSAALKAAESLEEWAAPEARPTKTEWRAGWGATTRKEPKGVVLIIAPWNYPVVLCLDVLVGAIAAGCTALVKPSELAPTVSALLAALVPAYLDTNAYALMQGAVPETTHALGLRWDHVLYTGSTPIGRVIAAACARHLTPTTLELGGKCGVVVAEDVCADPDALAIAARRIWHGRLQSAGQICVSPDYVLVPRAYADAFGSAVRSAHEAFFAEQQDGVVQVANIINAAHCTRMRNLLTRTKGRVLFGGDVSGKRYIAPALVADVPEEDSLMEEELFGPILPIVPVDSIDDAIRVLNSLPTPLAIYLFSNQETLKERFLQETRSGQLVVNDVVVQLAYDELPFGGQGDSGYGAWFGKATFDTFTHHRGTLTVPLSQEPFLQWRYRPYTREGYAATEGLHKFTIPEE